MKNHSLIVLLFLGFLSAKAQDTIIKFNGEQIPSKVLEITATEIKYKKFNFLSGPTYIEHKSEIQTIKYSNGTRSDVKAITKSDTVKAQIPSPSPMAITANDTATKQQIQSQPPKTVAVTNMDEYYTPPATPAKKVATNETEDYFNPQAVPTKKPVKANKTEEYYTPSGSTAGKLSIANRKFKKNNDLIPEKEFYQLLTQTNDKEIMALVMKSKRAKIRQYIYFDCCFGNAVTIFYPPVFLLTEPLFVSLYFKNKAIRKRSNKKAVELYNKR